MLKVNPQFGWAGNIDEERELRYSLMSAPPPGVLLVDPRMIDFDEQIRRWNMLSHRVVAGMSSSSSTVYKGWELELKLFGSYLPCVPQPEGDCVAASTERAIERLLVGQKVIYNERKRFRHVYRPYHYGVGRVIKGKNRIGSCGGSLITWQMEAVADTTWGVLQEGLEGLPRYSRSSVCDFGMSRATLEKWRSKAAGVFVEAFPITDLDTFVKSLLAGYGVCVASMRGFRMELKHDRQLKKSWFVPSGEWPHQMSFDALDLDCSVSCTKVDNQWGDNAHPGQLDGPSTGGWVPLDGNHDWTIAKWLKRGEFWGMRSFTGWPDPEMIDPSMI
jgi:hypothetical protein